jgi:transposase
LEGVVWRLRSGARWRDIPVDLPAPVTSWRRLQRWAGEGILEAIQTELLRELEDLRKLDLSQWVMDATFLRAKKGATTLGRPSAARGGNWR